MTAAEREKEARDEVYRLCRRAWDDELGFYDSPLQRAIFAYGRAVREADKEAAEGREGSAADGKRGVNLDRGEWQPAEYWNGRADAAAAIEALGEERKK